MKRAMGAMFTISMMVVALLVAFSFTTVSAGVECFELSFQEDLRPKSDEDAAQYIGKARHQVTVDVPANLQGLTASVDVTAANGRSVHVNNFASLDSASTVTVTGTEDTANGVKQSAETIVLGTQVVASYTMGARALGEVVPGISVNLTAVFCAETPEETTTTTMAETTTTTVVETTTTTVEDTTTTTAADTTTTTVPETTTLPPPTYVTTTIPPVEEPDCETNPEDFPGECLPFTGPEDMAALAGAGATLLVLGGAIVLGTREA